MPGNNEPAELQRRMTNNDPASHLLYREVWDGELQIGANVRNPQRGMVTKHFYAYIEAFEQTAHDNRMRQECDRGEGRPSHRGQVQGNNLGVAFYQSHGRVAATASAAEMQVRWTDAHDARVAAEADLAAANAALSTAANRRATNQATNQRDTALALIQRHGGTVFEGNRGYPLGIQAVRQSDGFSYEITLWYMVREVYVTFHCYPA